MILIISIKIIVHKDTCLLAPGQPLLVKLSFSVFTISAHKKSIIIFMFGSHLLVHVVRHPVSLQNLKEYVLSCY